MTPAVEAVAVGPHATPLLPWAGLVWTLVRTDFKARYHGTLSGFAWALLKPLAMFVVLMGVFSLVFASTPDYKLHLIIGLFLWDFFAEATKSGLTALHARGFLLTKARCPSWVLVVTSLSNAAITLTVFVVIITLFFVMAGRPPSAAALAAFVSYCGALGLIAIGFSLASSVGFLRYRDLNQVWEVALQAGFFVAPIVYPIGVLPERLHLYIYAWPPTAAIEFSRAALVNGDLPSARAHLLLFLMAGLWLAVGTVLFRRLSPRAAELL
jgi:lipopolysaccharide transport system permease protein